MLDVKGNKKRELGMSGGDSSVPTELIHVNIQVGAVRIMRYEDGIMYTEEMVGCVGRVWEEGE